MDGIGREEPRVIVEDVSYTYEDEEQSALNHVSMTAAPGEFVAVLGHNGSGKSTLAKLLNGLFIPTEGRVLVLGMDTADEKETWNIRQHVGMVFQNPDNQIVATVVREDVAFGLENMGVPTEEMIPRIDRALEAVRMTEYAQSAPHMLSGGQKQRVAIAGILAMEPDVLVLDESTAMLDPTGRKEVLQTVQKLNRENGITVVWITHFMEEAAQADRLIVMHEGGVALSGKPRDLFAQVQTIRDLGLDVPPMAGLAYDLRQAGIALGEDIMTYDEMAEAICQLSSKD